MTGRKNELLFASILEEVKQKAREQGNYISKEELTEAFQEIGLQPEQLKLVEDYLQKYKIGVGEPADPEDYLTEEEINYLESYLEELNNLETVSEGEKEAVTLSAMAGDAQAQAKLIEIFLPQVVQIAKLYTGQGVFLEDLIGEGNVALAAGVTMLGCLERVCEAEGMLGRLVMDAMEDVITSDMEEERAGKAAAEKVNRVAELSKELSLELQRKVTVEELAEETGLAREDILEALRISGDKIESIEKGPTNGK